MVDMQIFTRTVIEKCGIRYQVFQDKVVVWERFVPFGQTRRNRAGGVAFQEASDDQETYCKDLHKLYDE